MAWNTKVLQASVRIAGRCPGCNHPLVWEERLELAYDFDFFDVSRGRLGSTPRRRVPPNQLTHRCDCEHDDHDSSGCGHLIDLKFDARNGTYRSN